MGSVYKRNANSSYYICWVDAQGVRHARSSRTKDKRIAQRILADIENKAILEREGIVSAQDTMIAIANKNTIQDHIKAYIKWCTNSNMAARSVFLKQRHLDWLIQESGIKRISDMNADTITNTLALFRAKGKSARTVNHRRQNIGAFVSWCYKTNRTDLNPMRMVPKQDESRDRRRVRRSLTDQEVVNLLAVARKHGRWLWYALALYAGLRRGDLIRLRWKNIDLVARTITIDDGKAKRVDILPLHPVLVSELRDSQPLLLPNAKDKVFKTAVTARTQQNDFLRAGIARREVVTDETGNPVIIGKGKWKREKTFITTEDDQGRIADLHALRSTLGTMLARNGVAPQIAQKILRHSDYRTTLKHYTALTLADYSGAVDSLDFTLRCADESASCTE